jgi:S-adenosylmethionine:tRNA ribosyltransferase-isomerase
MMRKRNTPCCRKASKLQLRIEKRDLRIDVESSELDFELPPDLIAQEPRPDRAASRLLHYQRDGRTITHRVFADLSDLLRPCDLLVFNDAQVVPARFMLRKSTGGRVEGLFLEVVKPHAPSVNASADDSSATPVFPSPGTPGEGWGGGSSAAVKGVSSANEGSTWRVLLRNIGRADPGTLLTFESAPDATAEILEKIGDGEYLLAITASESPESLLDRIGKMPLPPYIRRDRSGDARDAMDRVRYQTVYAAAPGSVAAPTAGLHFTPQVLDALDKKVIERTTFTLHVGRGTFKPVTADTLESHAMHREEYEITDKAAAVLNRAEAEGRRIVAIGTTAARVLESHEKHEPWRPVRSATQIFIYPPYEWKHVGALVTNFHLPRSTLIALVAGMTGLDEQRRIYQAAIAERYRFFSYGDAMLVE